MKSYRTMFVKSQQEVSIDLVRVCLKVFVRPGEPRIKKCDSSSRF